MPQLLRPIWRQVTTWILLSGDLAAPDFEANPRDFLACEWLPPAFKQVDPMKQVQADVAEMNAGLTSRRKLVAARGWDLDSLDQELAADTFKPKGGTNAA